MSLLYNLLIRVHPLLLNIQCSLLFLSLRYLLCFKAPVSPFPYWCDSGCYCGIYCSGNHAGRNSLYTLYSEAPLFTEIRLHRQVHFYTDVLLHAEDLLYAEVPLYRIMAIMRFQSEPEAENDLKKKETADNALRFFTA